MQIRRWLWMLAVLACVVGGLQVGGAEAQTVARLGTGAATVTRSTSGR